MPSIFNLQANVFSPRSYRVQSKVNNFVPNRFSKKSIHFLPNDKWKFLFFLFSREIKASFRKIMPISLFLSATEKKYLLLQLIISKSNLLFWFTLFQINILKFFHFISGVKHVVERSRSQRGDGQPFLTGNWNSAEKRGRIYYTILCASCLIRTLYWSSA